MFQLFHAEDENQFTWESISHIPIERTNLGEDMPVFVYRLFQSALKDVLFKQFGNEATADIFRTAGELAGREFAAHLLNLDLPFDRFLSHLRSVLEENKIGILRIEQFDSQTGEAVLTVGEDLECSGMPITGETVCNYDEGFLAGILTAYTKKEYVVTEIDCWATGSRVCRFRAIVRQAGEVDHE